MTTQDQSEFKRHMREYVAKQMERVLSAIESGAPPTEATSFYGHVTISGPAEDVAFVVKHLPAACDSSAKTDDRYRVTAGSYTTPHFLSEEPVGYMSPQQLTLIVDGENAAGVYIPMRRTKRGNFTLPLYTAAPALTEEQERVFTAARNLTRDYRKCDNVLTVWVEELGDAIDALRSTQGGQP